MVRPRLQLLALGLRPYREVWELQRQLQQELIAGTGVQTLICCEHPPVITMGKSARMSNVIAEPEALAAAGVDVIPIERGGDVTWHGPGQLVVYPVLDLNTHRRDVGWYLRTLEEVIIQTLQEFKVTGLRYPGRTGVWTQIPENATKSAPLGEPVAGDSPTPRKIASIGVRLSRWCSLHGLALNVWDCRSGFALINPCGFSDIVMTSMEEEAGRRIDVEEVRKVLTARFVQIFDFRL